MLKRLSLVILLIFVYVSISPPRQAEAGAGAKKFNMSYLNYGTTKSFIANVDQTKGALQAVAPNYVALNPNGSLRISSQTDPAFVDAMHARKIKVVPFLNNDWDRGLAVKALENTDSLTSEIADAIKQNHWDGINVDLENLTEQQRDLYTDFIKKLRSKLPVGAELSVAIPANPKGYSKGYGGSVDVRAMSTDCDYFMLMAYDEHFPTDPIPGPVASLSFVEQSIQFALTQTSPDKLVLGIPFYGRYWNGNPDYDGLSLSNSKIDIIIDRYNGKRSYDETSQSAKAEFTIHAADPPTLVSKETLPLGNYTLWYENERSIKAKLALVQSYHLKGTGSWSLNQAAADTWNYYAAWANGFIYRDLENHWAKQMVLTAVQKGWMNGVSDTLFAPEQPLTRAQAAVILVRAKGWLQNAIDVPQTAAANFIDIPRDYWAAKEIALVQQKGFMDGVREGVFAPEQTLTREQFCALLARILTLPTTAAALPFPDVEGTRWSYTAISEIYGKHIVEGFGDGLFHPQQAITRAEMAVMMTRLPTEMLP